MNANKPNIIVAGMGPVGMTAALMLATKGLDITVLEAGDGLATESRASTFHPSTLEILNELGIVEELMEVGLKAPGFQYRGRNRELIAHLDMELLANDTAFPFRVQSEQSNLTQIILRHLETLPNVTLRFGAPIERVEEGADCAYVYLPGDGFEPSYRADWLIAADGSNSAARRSLGIAFEGVTYPERFLVVSTTHDFCEDFENLAYVSYIYDPEDWGVLLRTPKHWRVLFPIDPGESNAQATDAARIEERLQGVVALDHPYPVIHNTIYAVHQRIASTFARGRTLLVGDAAHINNPLGGMGMNSGIQDAEAAVQTVLYALSGGDPKRAATNYSKVRRDVAMNDVQKNTQKNYEEMSDRDSSSRSDKRQQMIELVADRDKTHAYLRSAALLASREISQQRLTRAFNPVETAGTPADGTSLSDALCEGSPLREGIDFDCLDVQQHDTASIATSTLTTELPLILKTPLTADFPQAVQMYEHLSAAAVVIEPQSFSTDDLDLLKQAMRLRRDMLVMATIDLNGTTESLTTALGLRDAGVDVLLINGTESVTDITQLHKQLPGLPLGVFSDELLSQNQSEQFALSGIQIVFSSVNIQAQ